VICRNDEAEPSDQLPRAQQHERNDDREHVSAGLAARSTFEMISRASAAALRLAASRSRPYVGDWDSFSLVHLRICTAHSIAF
jgi:hypothetical protein